MSYDVLTATPFSGATRGTEIRFVYPSGRTREDYETTGASLVIGSDTYRQSDEVYSLSYEDAGARVLWSGPTLAAGIAWTLRAPLSRAAAVSNGNPLTIGTATKGVGEWIGKGLASSRSQTLVVFGDSTANMNNFFTDASNTTITGNAWLRLALHRLDNRLRLVNVGGHSGFRTDQIMPFFDAEVAAYAPGCAFASMGTNDIIQGVTPTAAAANVEAFILKSIAIGARPIVCTIPVGESYNTAALRSAHQLLNQLIRRLAYSYGAILVDLEDVYVDPTSTTNAPIAGATDGSVHPANLGSWYVAEAVFEALDPVVPKAPQWSSLRAGGYDAVSNPLMAGTAGVLSGGATGTVADAFTLVQSTGHTLVGSKVAGDKGRLIQQVALTSTANTVESYLLGPALTLAGSNFAVGDKVALFADVETDESVTGAAGIGARLRFQGINKWASALTYPTNTGNVISRPVRRQVQMTPAIEIPVGTTSLAPYVYFHGANGSTYNARIHRVSVVKVD